MYNTTLSFTSNDLKQRTIVDPDHFPKGLHLDCSSGTIVNYQWSLENSTYYELIPVEGQFTYKYDVQSS